MLKWNRNCPFFNFGKLLLTRRLLGNNLQDFCSSDSRILNGMFIFFFFKEKDARVSGRREKKRGHDSRGKYS